MKGSVLMATWYRAQKCLVDVMLRTGRRRGDNALCGKLRVPLHHISDQNTDCKGNNLSSCTNGMDQSFRTRCNQRRNQWNRLEMMPVLQTGQITARVDWMLCHNDAFAIPGTQGLNSALMTQFDKWSVYKVVGMAPPWPLVISAWESVGEIILYFESISKAWKTLVSLEESRQSW